ncbi:hypothetical protein WMF28_06795 [Sorangium sp. So ce590]|uniref:hypothetical protein n=1 Tax=Sorangium sp. So ce590 TaxID=3133317 RepID=UPI003F6148BE
MRTVHSLAITGLLVGAFAVAGCGDDGGLGSGGAGGSPSSSSTSSLTGGTGSSNGTGAAGGGSGAGGGGSTDPNEQCSGCARLSVPLMSAGQATQFFIGFDEPVDLTGSLVTFRVKAHTGTKGGLQPFVQNGADLFWANIGYEWNPVAGLGEWVDITIDVDAAASTSPFFKGTVVALLGLQVTAGDTGPWANPTVIYVDSITVTRPASMSGARGAGSPSGERGAGGEGAEGGASGEGGAGGTSGAGGEGGAGGTSGAGGEGGAGGTSGAGGEGGAGGTSGAGGEGGAGGTSGAGGEGGAGGTSGEGGAGGVGGEGGVAGAGGVGGAGGAGGAGGEGGEGGEGGGPGGDVVHVVGPFEFTTGVEPMVIGDYMPVAGSTLLHIAD